MSPVRLGEFVAIVFSVRIDTDQATDFLTAAPLLASVHDDSVQPAAEDGGVLQLRQLAVGGHKGILYHVLGVCSVTQETQRNGERGVLVPPYQGLEGVGVTFKAKPDVLDVVMC